MSRTLLIQKEERGTCPVSFCEKEGIRSPIEILPDGGLYIRFRHVDGTEHGWAEYTDIMQVQIGKKTGHKQNPKHIICPHCGRPGIVNSWRPDDKKLYKVSYYVRHGKITYGKGNSRSQERCMIDDNAERDEILKKLGRYIIATPVLKKLPKTRVINKAKVNCPKCHHRGRLGNFTDKGKSRQYIQHEQIEGTWGKSKTPKHRRCYIGLTDK